MTISDENILQFINADYETILDEIQATKEELMPEWTDDSDTDFGNLILTYVAMLADILSWKIDYSINECIPTLCETMKSMYKHCKWIGYNPTSNKSAKATLELTFVNNGKKQTLKDGFQVTMEDMINGEYVIYELDGEVDITAPDGIELDEQYVIECSCTQGESVSETIGYSNGLSDQEFMITFSPYIEGSLVVEAYNATDETSEMYSTNLNNSFVGAESDDAVIVLEHVDSYNIKVKFGDGYNGKIPKANSQLIAHYRIGGGAIGNRPIGVINTPVDEMPDNFISLTNTSEAYGGEDALDIEGIKEIVGKGEHKIIYSLMRREDYEKYLAKQDEFEKCKVCKGVENSSKTNSYIWIYVKPYNALTLTDEQKTTLLADINKLKLMTDVVEIKDCQDVKVQISVSAMSDGITNKSQLEGAIKYAIQDYVNSLKIGANINDVDDKDVGLYIEDVKDIVKQIDGIYSRTVEVKKLALKDDSIILSEKSTSVDENVTNMILDIGQYFEIEDIETDIEVEIS